MKKIIAATLLISSVMFTPSGLAQDVTNSQVQTPEASRELLAVSASAVRDKNYPLALRVANNVIELYPNYGTAHLYKAITLYKLGELGAAKVEFTIARDLYQRQLETANVTPQQEAEARSGLKVVKLHLELLTP